MKLYSVKVKVEHVPSSFLTVAIQDALIEYWGFNVRETSPGITEAWNSDDLEQSEQDFATELAGEVHALDPGAVITVSMTYMRTEYTREIPTFYKFGGVTL